MSYCPARSEACPVFSHGSAKPDLRPERARKPEFKLGGPPWWSVVLLALAVSLLWALLAWRVASDRHRADPQQVERVVEEPQR